MTRSRLVKSWVDRPYIDFILALAAALVFWQGSNHVDIDPIRRMNTAARHEWFGGLATLSGALLGFSVATVSIVFAVSPGPRLRSVIRTVGPDLNTLMAKSLSVLAFCTAGFVLLVPGDTGRMASGVRFAVPAFLLLGGLAVVRLLWLFSRIIGVFAADVTEADTALSPELTTGYVPPVIEDDDYEPPITRKLAAPVRRPLSRRSQKR